MATTTNFGWTTPDDTAYVKDGAAAMRTLGSAIDTSMGDLKGGATGEVLSKASGTDMDFTWVSNGWTALTNAALSGSSVDLTIPSGYNDIRLYIKDASSSVSAAIRMRFGTGGVVDTASNYNQGTSAISFLDVVSVDASATTSQAVVDISDYTDAVMDVKFGRRLSGQGSSQVATGGFSWVSGNNDLDIIRIYLSTGTFSAGNVYVVGRI